MKTYTITSQFKTTDSSETIMEKLSIRLHNEGLSMSPSSRLEEIHVKNLMAFHTRWISIDKMVINITPSSDDVYSVKTEISYSNTPLTIIFILVAAIGIIPAAFLVVGFVLDFAVSFFTLALLPFLSIPYILSKKEQDKKKLFLKRFTHDFAKAITTF